MHAPYVQGCTLNVQGCTLKCPRLHPQVFGTASVTLRRSGPSGPRFTLNCTQCSGQKRSPNYTPSLTPKPVLGTASVTLITPQALAPASVRDGVAPQAWNPCVASQAWNPGVASQAWNPCVASQAWNPCVASQAWNPCVASQAEPRQVSPCEGRAESGRAKPS